MRLNTLGGSGLRVSSVGLGCNNFGLTLNLEQTRGVVEAALEKGVTFLDTADVYGHSDSERFLGEILKGRRDQVVLATKFGMDMGDGTRARGSSSYVRQALEASLGRLQTDYIDLYYYHRPDGITPLAETIGVLHELEREGLIRAIGVSNVTVEELEEASAAGEVAAAEINYSLLNRAAARALLPRCRELGVGFIPYWPLAHGVLTGKYQRGEPPPAGTRLDAWPDDWPSPLTDENFDRVARLEAFAQDHHRTLLELAIGALIAEPGVASVIAGATTPEQVRANAAAGQWELTQTELAEVHSLAGG